MRVNSATQTSRPQGNPVGSHLLLRYGSRGPQVSELQRKLKAQGLYSGAIDGAFGPKTLAGVKAYQKAKGLQVDGVVGQQTWGSFYGMKLSPGSSMLGGKAPTGPVGVVDSFDGPLGNGRPAAAYINGQARNITVYSVGNGQYMRSDAAKAFLAMQADARRAGVNLSATSGFRTMAQQQELYRRYLAGTGNLAARPGYSNHQGGISMDVGGINGYGTAAYSWLRNNASRYGFANDVGGEYWHWTFKG